MAKPSAQDLAEAGFFYAPLQGCEDRVACYACGKVLFNWDPNDEIADAHKLFSPHCPLVTGKPVEIPSAVKPAEKPSLPWEVAKPAGDADGEKGANGNGHLSNFINSIRQGAAAAEPEDGSDVLLRPKGSKGGKKKVPKDRSKGDAVEFPPASMSDGPENNTGSDTDGPDTAASAAAAAALATAAAASSQARSDRLWKFDWSVPSVVRTGLRGEGAILDAAAGELEIRLNTAKRLISSQKDDWSAAARHAEVACQAMELAVNAKLDAAQQRLEAMQPKVAKVAECAAKLRDDEELKKRTSTLARLRQEDAELKEEMAAGKDLLRDLRSKTDAERADLELIKDKDRLLKELTASISAQEARVRELSSAAESAEQRAATATREKEEMHAEMTRVRDQLKDEISEQHQAKLALEASLGEMTEQVASDVGDFGLVVR